jgi:hypothetical protein
MVGTVEVDPKQPQSPVGRLPPLREDHRGRSLRDDRVKVEADARFDGIFVLRTNIRLSALQAVLRYRNLLASTKPMPVSVVTCSARSSRSCCARI